MSDEVDEKSGILSAIKDAGDNISAAARRLGVARRTLQSRMRAYGIAKGTPGRRKMKISYSKARGHFRKHKKAYAVGALVGVAGVVLLKRRGSSA